MSEEQRGSEAPPADGARGAESERPDVAVEVRIDAPPERVFDYVTDPARFPGVEHGAVRLGEVVERDAPRRVRWRAGAGDAADAVVEVTLAPDGDGTRVRVSQWTARDAHESRAALRIGRAHGPRRSRPGAARRSRHGALRCGLRATHGTCRAPRRRNPLEGRLPARQPR